MPDLLLIATLGVAGPAVLVLVHEAGHAVAAAGLGVRVGALEVGGGPGLALVLGGFRLRLSLDVGAAGGLVLHAPTDRRRAALVAAAGPAASLLGAAATAYLATRSGHWLLTAQLVYLTVAGLLLCALNLVPSGDPRRGDASDGMWIALARDPRRLPLAAPAAAPPPPAATAGPAVRPWAVWTIVAVVALTLAAGAWLNALALVILFGGAYLAGYGTAVR